VSQSHQHTGQWPPAEAVRALLRQEWARYADRLFDAVDDGADAVTARAARAFLLGWVTADVARFRGGGGREWAAMSLSEPQAVLEAVFPDGQVYDRPRAG
jgi:hypothetical protein